MRHTLPLVIVSLLVAQQAHAQVDARMLRFPDVSETQVTFVYAGDIWVAPKAGGRAERLSSPEGAESFPRFSPDGSQIAFTGNYDGNQDVYVIPATGGLPVRVTHHPMSDRVVGWHPDGSRVLFASSRESGRQRFSQFYLAPAGGGLAEKLPIPYGETGSLSQDGRVLAYTPRWRDFRTWKRYRGGMQPDIWLFDLETLESQNVTDSDTNESHPMWHGDTVYFLSDAGPNARFNIWAFDRDGSNLRQITRFSEDDVRFPSSGPSDIVFENAGGLYLLSLDDESIREIEIDLVSDLASVKPRTVDVASFMQSSRLSPTGKRVVVEARGDIFTLPAEDGVVRNLTMSSGAADRYPSWSPDGKHIAYFSDASGEYELTLRPANGGEARTVTRLGPGFRYQLFWSPDSKHVAFVDQSMTIQVANVETGQITRIGEGKTLYEGGLRNFGVSWSPDSRWIAYSKDLSIVNRAVVLYDMTAAQEHQVTAGYYVDSNPSFDPDGKYLYLLTSRTFNPMYGDVDNSFLYANSTNLAVIPLAKSTPSPLAPRNDAEVVEDADTDEAEETSDDDGANATQIDLDGMEARLVVLPPGAGNYADLQAGKGKVFYRRNPRTGAGGGDSPVLFFDLESREEKTVIGDADGFELSHDGKKMLIANGRRLGVVDAAPGQSLEKTIPLAEMSMTIDPREEWKQVFTDAWRFQRDYFYDQGMHGVDWDGLRTHYEALLEDAVTRWDVTYVVGELVAELNASHTYVQGGDTESAESRPVGLLGVDWELANNRYRIQRIVKGAPWDNEVRSPLSAPGIDVSEGDYVLAVNGREMTGDADPHAAFEGLAGKTVVLSINSQPTTDGAREVIVELLEDETRLRHLEWVEAKRKRVEEASGGRIGYIYVQDTTPNGQSELVRQFRAQYGKDALIIDERFNSGGQIPDRFVELLNRPAHAHFAVRDGTDWSWPPVAHHGPKAMLINGWSGSGGDAFPDYFRKAGLGPLIGERTWGGLIGISGAPTLVDGGAVTVPTFRQYNPDGTWFPEGVGVDPDIGVADDPSQMARGIDTQLEAAITELLRELEENPQGAPMRPAYEDRSGARPTVVRPKG